MIYLTLYRMSFTGVFGVSASNTKTFPFLPATPSHLYFPNLGILFSHILSLHIYCHSSFFVHLGFKMIDNFSEIMSPMAIVWVVYFQGCPLRPLYFSPLSNMSLFNSFTSLSPNKIVRFLRIAHMFFLLL